MELQERKRSIDIANLSKEEAENLSQQIGGRVRAMVDEAAEKINALLKIYSMEAKLSVVIGTPVVLKKQRKSRKQS